MSPASRLLRAIARIATPGLLLAGVAAPAAAQDCLPGALSTYLGTSCDLGGWRFSDFFLSADATADGPTTAAAPAADGSDVVLTPFSFHTPGGTHQFGFTIGGLAVHASVIGGPGTEGTAVARAIFGFLAASIDGTDALTHAGFDIGVSGATNTPGRTDLYQAIIGSVFDPVAGTACAERFLENFGPGDKPRSVLRACDAPNPTEVGTVLFLEADGHRFDSRRTENGTSTAVASLVLFQAVPEPATVALVGGGLLGLAAVARRRA